jgi:hypothetical protein
LNDRNDAKINTTTNTWRSSIRSLRANEELPPSHHGGPQTSKPPTAPLTDIKIKPNQTKSTMPTSPKLPEHEKEPRIQQTTFRLLSHNPCSLITSSDENTLPISHNSTNSTSTQSPTSPNLSEHEKIHPSKNTSSLVLSQMYIISSDRNTRRAIPQLNSLEINASFKPRSNWKRIKEGYRRKVVVMEG